MAFFCPNCRQFTLEIELAIELPDDAWDENTLQLVACRNCGLQAAALYQESRRGNLQDEACQHTGVVIAARDYAALAGDIRACPNPESAGCTCPTHRVLKEMNFFEAGAEMFPVVWGRWKGDDRGD